MRSLVGLFFRMEEVKKETGVEALGVGAVKPRKIGRVGVLGAGVMGGGIAQLAADRGLPVRMKDIKPEALALGYAQAARIWKEKLKKRRMTRAEFAGKMALLGGSLDYAGFETCDITIEAVLEKMAVKHAVLAEWEKVVPATRDLRVEHLDAADHGDRRERGAPRARRRHALLQPRLQDAARRGHLREEDRPRGHGDDLRPREEDGEDAGRREGLAGLPREPHPRAVHRRGGAARPRGRRLHGRSTRRCARSGCPSARSSSSTTSGSTSPRRPPRRSRRPGPTACRRIRRSRSSSQRDESEGKRRRDFISMKVREGAARTRRPIAISASLHLPRIRLSLLPKSRAA